MRLGQGVDATGEFDPEAIERTRVALHDYVALCATHATGCEWSPRPPPGTPATATTSSP